METYTINKQFETDAELKEWLENHLERDKAGLATYQGKRVWVINTEVDVNPDTMKRGPITLRSIDTWN